MIRHSANDGERMDCVGHRADCVFAGLDPTKISKVSGAVTLTG